MVVSFYFHHLSTMMWFFLTSTLSLDTLFLRCGFFYLCLSFTSKFIMPSFLAKGCTFILSFAATSTFAQDCVLTVLPNPLSSTGLAPYTLTECNQIGFSNQGVFVEVAIFDPTTSSVSVYNPLVVNPESKAGTDFTAPAPVTVPKGATVGI